MNGHRADFADSVPPPVPLEEFGVMVAACTSMELVECLLTQDARLYSLTSDDPNFESARQWLIGRYLDEGPPDLGRYGVARSYDRSLNLYSTAKVPERLTPPDHHMMITREWLAEEKRVRQERIRAHLIMIPLVPLGSEDEKQSEKDFEELKDFFLHSASNK